VCKDDTEVLHGRFKFVLKTFMMRIPGEVYKKVCVVCGKHFTARRSNAKCCSSTCRVTLSRSAKEVVFETGGQVEKVKQFIEEYPSLPLPAAADMPSKYLKPLDIEKRYRSGLGSLGAPMNRPYRRYLFATAEIAIEYAKKEKWYAEHGKDLIIEGLYVYVPDGWSTRSWNK
jgi:hypothetical protein